MSNWWIGIVLSLTLTINFIGVYNKLDRIAAAIEQTKACK